MRLRAQLCVIMALVAALAGCATGPRIPPPIYQDDFLTVRLEPNPAGAGQSFDGKGTQTITAQQLSGVLKGLYGRNKSVIDSQPEPVFQEEELKLVARELSKGLRVASPQERVAFQLRRAREKDREETSGAIYLRGNLLYVSLVQFRSPGSVRFDDGEYIQKPNFELLYEPAGAVIQKEQGIVSQIIAAAAFPEVIIDIQKVSEGYAPTRARPVLAPRTESSEPERRPPQTSAVATPPKTESVATPPSSPTSTAVTVEALQQQVKDLAESNEALRAKLKQVQGGQEPSQSVTEELVRLRQELAETKQLLGEKVLELNRLKKKSE